MGTLKDELQKVELPDLDEDNPEITTLSGRVKDYLDKRDVGLMFTTTALCAAMHIPLEDAQARKNIATILGKAKARRYLTEIDRQAGHITWRLDKDGEWNTRHVREPDEDAPRNQGVRDIPKGAPVHQRVRILLAGWPVGSRCATSAVATQLGYRKLSREVSTVRSSLWRMVQEGDLKSLGGGEFEIVHPIGASPDEKFEEVVKVYEAPPEPGERRHGVYTMPDGSTWDSSKGPLAAVPPPEDTWKASDPDLQVLLNQVLMVARMVRDTPPPEAHRGLDDYSMDELLDAIALKRMGGK